MDVFHGLPEERPRACALTIGNFDGVHRGHQHLIQRMIASAREAALSIGALTFSPHPSQVLQPQRPATFLTTLEERLRLLEELGLDFVVVYPFSRETANTSAEAFVSALVDRLRMRQLWVGPDFALGRNREGDVPTLKRLGQSMGFTVHVVEPVTYDGVEVRSGIIRQLIEAGQVDRAARLLSRPYRLSGTVVEGARRGRLIGLPTANLAPPEGRLIPAHGVYATRCHVDGSPYVGATNIGTRPTFDNGKPTVETHLLDFQGDLYGRVLHVEFILRLRPEQRFASVDELTAQIRRDIRRARQALTPASGLVEELDYTADWGMEVTGEDLEDLFAQAAAAMYRLQAVDMERQPEIWREVDIEAPDREALMVAWLSELLYLSEVHQESYTRFVIDEADELHIRARVGGVPGLGEKAHIKAVTYHDLAVEPTNAGWRARVLFDT